MEIEKHKSLNKSVKLDLAAKSAAQPVECIAEFKISFGRRLLRFRTPKDSLKLKIIPQCDPKAQIVIKDGFSLLTIECNEKKGSEISVQINGESFVYLRVMFNHAAIMDCEETEISEFNIEYTIECETSDHGKETKKDNVSIELVPISVEPEIRLEKRSFDYVTKSVEGVLQLKNSSVIHYAPTVGMRITGVWLSDPTGDRINNDVVKLQWDKATRKKGYFPKTIIAPIESQLQIVNGKNEIGIIYPEEGYWINLPFVLNLNYLPNPQQEYDEYTLHIEYEYWTSSSQTPRIRDEKGLGIRINKNHERVELGVNLLAGNKVLPILSDVIYAEQPVIVNARDFRTPYQIVIQNTATVVQGEHPNAGVVIQNFNSSPLTLRNQVVAKDSDSKTVNLDQICSCRPIAIEQKRLLPNESIVVGVVFHIDKTIVDHFLLGNKKQFIAEAEVKVSFDYYIDETGNNVQKGTHYEGTVVFKLEVEPRREWLGVDFGTSAVVALYGNTINLENARAQNCIQDLKSIKQKGLNLAFQHQDKSYRSITDEERFINSKIVLGDDFPNGIKQVMNFKDYPKGQILFSPGDSFTYSKLLPSLKSMMGYKHIPRNMGGSTLPPLVDDIYEMAYQQLFNLYLKGVSNGQPIEKVVMTYPNTFAANHVERLKRIAEECLPTLRKDYIVTVSESDAVAYRYLMCRKQLLSNYAGNDVDRNVLIYDMGAGTLDITYFSNIWDGKTRKVDIKGKFGISKAGNYLDYVLAEIVVDICNRHNIKDVNGDSFDAYLSLESNRSGDIETISKLKDYVKDKLKPLLSNIKDINSNSEVKMPVWENANNGNLDTVSLSEVYHHDKFKEFISDISEKVIQGCNSIFPSKLNDIDVVVFSGRMTSMLLIRKAVLDAIKSIIKKDKVIAIDIAKNETRGNEQLQLRKTAVVEGALNYVESFRFGGNTILLPPKPFFAHYCVIVQSSPVDFEVIDHVDNSMVSCGYSSTTNINLTNVYALYLVQTYAVGNDAIIKDFANDRNLTTMLAARETSNFYGMHDVAITVQCQDSDNRFEQGTKAVSLSIDNAEVAALPHDNITSTAFRKSAWPIVF